MSAQGVDIEPVGPVGPGAKAGRARSEWTLLSNHGHVLVCIAADHDSRLRDIARLVGITERAVFGIVEDLEYGGMIKRIKVGRRNTYEINMDQPLRHDIIAGHTVRDLLDAIAYPPSTN